MRCDAAVSELRLLDCSYCGKYIPKYLLKYLHLPPTAFPKNLFPYQYLEKKKKKSSFP